MIVVSGSVSIYGAVVEASSSLDIIAPGSQALPVIECSPKSKKRKVEKPSASSNEYDAIFILKSTRTGLGDIGRICPRFDTIWKPSLIATTIKSEISESFTPILTSPQSTAILAIPPSWQSAITSLSSTKQSPKSIFIVGGKSVGKSTLGRFLLNAIVTSQSPSRTIVYLDLDPGQPSFTPPCMLSLHKITSPIVSPSFAAFTSTEILRQHHMGYTSPREDPKYYLRCARDLMLEYRKLAEHGEKLTLVVNTCGWVKGMGRELLQELVLICEPTDMVGLGDVDGVFAEIIPPAAAATNIKKHVLEAAGPGGVSNSNSSTANMKNGIGNTQQLFTPADLRMLQTIAYFHHLPKTPDAQTTSFDFENHLTAIPPLLAGYKGVNKVIDGITVLDADITAEFAFTAINATIVAINLVKGDDKAHPVVECLDAVYAGNDDVVPYISSRQFDGTSVLLPTESTFTIGLAIVRGVDEEQGQLQLLTPISDGELNRWIDEGYKIVLTRGRDELPVWLAWDWRDVPLQKQRRRGTGSGGVEKMPYLDFVVGGQVTGKGAKEWKVRRNIMRRSQHRR
ncbi:Polynucleotide 5'-hydroxyl-kinase grc3 [Orbilia ellipsospora]